MAGVDTVRGIAFQHAYAIQLALDVVEDKDSESLTIEGYADVVDVELSRAASPTRPIFQIKSRGEPYSWTPGELADVIRAWEAAGGGQEAPLRFVSDGPASPGAVKRLKPAIERARLATLSEDDRRYLRNLRLNEQLLRHVDLATRSEGTGALLAMAENRVRRLLGLVGPVGRDDAEHAVDRLLRLFVVEGGEARIERRTFTRTNLADALGVTLDVVDTGEEWTAETADEYRAGEGGDRAPHLLVELVALLDPTARTPALSLTVTSDSTTRGGVQQPALGLIDVPKGAGLCGAAGTGKSTTTRQMVEHAGQIGRTAVAVSAASYRRGDLERRIRRTFEQVLRRPLVRTAIATALAEPGATLILDGLTGLLPEQLDALAADIHDLLERHPTLRTIVVDRDRTFPRRFELSTYTLSPLDSKDRAAIATGLVDDPVSVVADLEHRLGDVTDNPLLFVMALALTRVGIGANGRSAIFQGFIDGLHGRTKKVSLDESDLAALRLGAVALAIEGRFAADRYWWLANLAEALDTLRSGGIYEVGDRTGEAVFMRLLTMGLLFEDDLAASVGLLHDAFRDYLASVALARGEAEFPRPVSAEWEVACELLAEQSRLSAEHCRVLAADNPIAATRAARFDTGTADAALVGELARALAAHLGSPPYGSDFGVVVVRGTGHIYALVAPGEADGELSMDDAAALAAVSPAAVALRPEAGSLALAAALWREMLNRTTAAEAAGLHRPVPTTHDELAEAVARQFREQQQELASLAHRLIPTLADRLIQAVGWSGLRAHIGDAETVEMLPSQQQRYHPMEYALGGDGVIVNAGEEADVEEYSASTTAESFVEDTPRAVALNALVGELKNLLPEIE